MTDEKMLDRVRKLLSKAERAGSEHEAEAFTAKATELMLKYAIDEAMLQSKGEKPNEKIVAKRVTVEGYAKAKLTLMHKVAAGLGLKSVEYTMSRRGWSTGAGEVLGWESDVAAFDVLFASLQMQAATEAKRELARLKRDFPKLRAAWEEWYYEDQENARYREGESYSERRDRYRAWQTEHPQPENPGREVPHGRAFMQSFLIGYAGVVGSRLREQRRTTIKQAEDTMPGTALAVVDRDKAVANEWERRHPPSSFTRGGRGASNSANAGYYAGRSAGSRANLGQTSVGGGRRAIGGGR